MFRYVLLTTLVVFTAAAPTSEEKPEPKPLALIAALKTPASTAKLTPIVTPVHQISGPLLTPISHITYSAPALSHIAPYAYAYAGPLLAAAPSSYSIEQHGYNIVY